MGLSKEEEKEEEEEEEEVGTAACLTMADGDTATPVTVAPTWGGPASGLTPAGLDFS